MLLPKPHSYWIGCQKRSAKVRFLKSDNKICRQNQFLGKWLQQ